MAMNRDINSDKDFSMSVDEYLSTYKPGPFIPYAVYNAHRDSITVYFKKDRDYTQPLNDALELHLSQETNEIVGATIFNIKKLCEKQDETN
jgi:hypothetical protein